jgi:hypothetical protein
MKKMEVWTSWQIEEDGRSVVSTKVIKYGNIGIVPRFL